MFSPELIETLNDAAVAAARSSFSMRGRGDRKGADQLAVEAMRTVLDSSSFGFEVVVGEGEKDQAPMLSVGEVLGKGSLSFDIAVDPLEGTNYVAKGQPGAISVIVCSERGSIQSLPGYYMNKVVAPKSASGSISLLDAPEELVFKVADHSHKQLRDVTVAILEKPRNRELINSVRALGARVVEVPDGDVVAAYEVLTRRYDLLLGVGGAPEGVIMAALANCLDGHFQGRLEPQSDVERRSIAKRDSSALDVTFSGNDLCAADSVVVIASVTGTASMAEPHYDGGDLLITSSVISKSKIEVFTNR
ncbi:MAG: fructose-bisphosphatase class II [Actinomycetota bacterium]|nr:fructose-bisphosphatase class II [Actinomycetota bacterium]